MNNRIYPKDLFEIEVNRLKGKVYCPNCYSNAVIVGNVSYYPYIESKERGTSSCHNCSMVFNFNNLLTKDEVRDRKIDEITKK